MLDDNKIKRVISRGNFLVIITVNNYLICQQLK